MKQIILTEKKLINDKIYDKGTAFTIVKEETEDSIELEKSIFLEKDLILSKGTILVEKYNLNNVSDIKIKESTKTKVKTNRGLFTIDYDTGRDSKYKALVSFKGKEIFKAVSVRDAEDYIKSLVNKSKNLDDKEMFKKAKELTENKVNINEEKVSLDEAIDSIDQYLSKFTPGHVEMFGNAIGNILERNYDSKTALQYLKALRQQLIKEMDYIKRGM